MQGHFKIVIGLRHTCNRSRGVARKQLGSGSISGFSVDMVAEYGVTFEMLSGFVFSNLLEGG